MVNENTEIHLTEEQKVTIQLRINHFLEACQLYKIPCFITAAIENDTSGTKYTSSIYHDQKLTEDKIALIMKVLNGYQVVDPREIEDSIDPYLLPESFS